MYGENSLEMLIYLSSQSPWKTPYQLTYRKLCCSKKLPQGLELLSNSHLFLAHICPSLNCMPGYPRWSPSELMLVVLEVKGKGGWAISLFLNLVSVVICVTSLLESMIRIRHMVAPGLSGAGRSYHMEEHLKSYRYQCQSQVCYQWVGNSDLHQRWAVPKACVLRCGYLPLTLMRSTVKRLIYGRSHWIYALQGVLWYPEIFPHFLCFPVMRYKWFCSVPHPNPSGTADPGLTPSKPWEYNLSPYKFPYVRYLLK